MGLMLTYKNGLGTVKMQGGGNELPLRITALEGFGPVLKDYNSAVYAGYDGQETLNSRAMARSITIALELLDKNIVQTVRDALRVFSEGGTLYIRDKNLDRRIICNQVQIPDVARILRGQIVNFAVQFICDNPFFEDSCDTVVPIYERRKLIETPFTLPGVFGEIILGGEIQNIGENIVEPIITIYSPEGLKEQESIILTNEATGKTVRLDYALGENETITIDIKSRKVISNIKGNIINYISDDTFLGDFVLVKGINVISVNLGDVTSGLTIECRYNNLYNEAVIV